MELLEKDLVYRVVGCALEVHNILGHGFREKTYERALCVEMRLQGIAHSKQGIFPVLYKGETVDEFVPDLLVENRLILELKTADAIIDDFRGQILNYLKVTGLKVGLILNFRHAKLEWERLVRDTPTP
jgi:GxxExxY protein